MKKKKFFIFTLTMVIYVSLIKNIKCEINESQKTRGERDLNTNTNTLTNTHTNTHSVITQELVYSDCVENESVEACISKATCCHINISKRKFIYSACVDALSEQNFETFCKKFYEYAGGNGFTGNECMCKNFIDSFSNYYQISHSYFIFTIGILIVVIF